MVAYVRQYRRCPEYFESLGRTRQCQTRILRGALRRFADASRGVLYRRGLVEPGVELVRVGGVNSSRTALAIYS